jgi:hypothetical protein
MDNFNIKTLADLVIQVLPTVLTVLYDVNTIIQRRGLMTAKNNTSVLKGELAAKGEQGCWWVCCHGAMLILNVVANCVLTHH